MISTASANFIFALVLMTVLLLAPSTEAWSGNKAYDNRNLFGVVASKDYDDYGYATVEDADSVPDAFLIFSALLRWLR
ncbi:expressed unknown protein [Seminavis robusta]|uniref:Uncharacterized protein n=1 Tax=Seminavis robusta TaxID=568900 RepID=A0A9N8HYF9_9STRA|nr:unknown protein [Seminavis robusta]CAB9530337.1 expressed unknown protein [Seminavis robusta]|eukprot:Sro1901_g304380.1 n/a (78) ;mRNA; f:19293-19526